MGEKTAAQRKEMILSFLMQCLWAMRKGEIARAVGLGRTPYLEKLLKEMTDIQPDGSDPILIMEWIEDPRYGRTRVWTVNRERGQ